MSTYRRTIPVDVEVLGDREVRITMSTAARARDGHILEPAGCDLGNYRANPILLWLHKQEFPIGNAEDVVTTADGIVARAVFAPEGISAKADEICGLAKAGVLRAVSIAFDILDGEPIDPARPRAGLRVSKWELLECSFVSVPADTGALVTAREHNQENGEMADAKNWDKARKRMLTASPAIKQRGLSTVASLAWLLMQLGWVHDETKWETEIEGDNSPVPAMLGEALKGLGDTLIAMTQEEVAELMAGQDIEIDEDEIDELPAAERAHVRAAPAGPRRALRFALARMNVRAGAELSKENIQKLKDGAEHLETATSRAETMSTSHNATRDAHAAIGDAHSAAATAHDKLGEALKAATDEPAAAGEHLARCMRAYRAIGKQIDAVGTAHATAEDSHGDAMDAANGTVRAMRAAARCFRSLFDDTDTDEIQTSDGIEDSEGSENDRSFAARQARKAALAVAA